MTAILSAHPKAFGSGELKMLDILDAKVEIEVFVNSTSQRLFTMPNLVLATINGRFLC